MAITTILSNEELIVQGPPSSVTVSVDVGPKGARGSTFFYGAGLPVSSNLSGTPQIGDLYIRTDSGENYSVIYQLQFVSGGSSWLPVLKFQPVIYNISSTVNFTSGSGSVSFPLAKFYSEAPANFDVNSIVINATVELDNPAMICVSNKEIKTVSGTKTLVTELKAAEFSSGSVIPLVGLSKTNLSYSVGGA